jgi:hypothetical protein
VGASSVASRSRKDSYQGAPDTNCMARARCPPTPSSQKRLLGTPASRQPAGPFDSAQGRQRALQSFLRSLFSRRLAAVAKLAGD